MKGWIVWGATVGLLGAARRGTSSAGGMTMRYVLGLFSMGLVVFTVAACDETLSDEDEDEDHTIESACQKLAQASCERTARCYPVNLPANCVADTAWACAQGMQAADVNATPNELAECADTYSVACNVLLDCYYSPGARADGQPCSTSLQCQNDCLPSEPYNGCGTCGPLPVLGQPCAGYSCADGLSCDIVNNICIVSAEPLDAGEPCDVSAGPYCDSRLHCDSETNTCVPYAQQNEPCTSVTDCDYLMDLGCDPSTNTCQPHPVAAAGQPCGYQEGLVIVCEPACYCNEATVCELLPGEGQPCGGQWRLCEHPLSCMNDICSRLDPSVCG